MKKLSILSILLASFVCVALCGCESNDDPVIVKNVSRMTHFMRVDVSSELAYIADVVCECKNIYGEQVEESMFGSSTHLVEDSWTPDMGILEPEYVTMTLKATPRGGSDVTESSYRLEAFIQSEFSIYDQNNEIMGYNGFEKSMSKNVSAGTDIKSFLKSNFPVTYTFRIEKGNNAYNVSLE